jgi:capsule assembly protein Wzi/PAP2 superfamily protein
VSLKRNRKIGLIFLFFAVSTCSWAQDSPAPAPNPTPIPSQDDDRHLASDHPVEFLRNLARDQKDIWTSPFRVKPRDLNWVVPWAGLTAGFINSDAETASRVNPNNSFSKHASTISNGGLGVALGGSAGFYLLGKIRGDDHQKETGIIASEAVLNAYIVFTGIKLVTQRARPTDGNFKGEFYNSSSITNSSFPSGHATMTWAAATVLAQEYPGPLTKVFAYGLASAVSAARIAGHNHFPSDVLVGSVAGWLIGREVYHKHHDPDLPGSSYGVFVSHTTIEGVPYNRASAYVPMDSWVYPAFERLAGLGLVNSGMMGLRPWTRKECARLLEEASTEVDEDNPDEGWRLYSALAREFAPELNGEERDHAELESVYARVTGISGQPLTDGYHFGQSIVNDYGRPYQHGANALAGFTSSIATGALGFYVRGEYEHAPSGPGFTQAQQDAINAADLKLGQPALPVPAFNQLRLLDSYLSLNINGWQTSFGKQTLWTGPTQDPFLWSDNAEPMYMLRVDQTHPAKLPSILKFLGPLRTEWWVGKMTGHHWVNTQDPTIGVAETLGRTLSKQPMVNGVKFNFKPTANFEFGIGRTGMFGGPDFPITLGSVRHSLFSTTNTVGRGSDPGDRRSTVDFSYRLPGFRNLLTLYDDSFVEDEISPIGYPRRAAHNPGIYLTQLPGVPHLDLRIEAAYTNLPGLLLPPQGGFPLGGFFYWNTRYLDGYTNKGNILGNATVGRQGISYRAQSTYWFASDRTLQFGYRQEIADSMFLQGGNLRDAFFKSEWRFNPRVSLTSFLQYEWWNFPLLSVGNKKNDFTASFQLTYWPHWKFKRGE